MMKELDFLPNKKAYEMIEFACGCITFKDEIELELTEVGNELIVEYQFLNFEDKVLLSNVIYKAQEQFKNENFESDYKQFEKNYLGYLNYTDPVIGYDEEEAYEIRYSDVYGFPEHQISYGEYITTIV